MSGELVDRSFVTSRLIAVAVGSLVVTGGMLAYVQHSTNAQPPQERPLTAGDTPVVLVGDSMKFKAGLASYPWVQDTQFTAYHTAETDATNEIVVKSDDSTDADVLKFEIPNVPWEVDEYVNGNANPVATITPYASGGLSASVIPDTNGVLCPVVVGNKKVELDYYSTNTGGPGACAGTAVSFSQISIVVTPSGGSKTTIGTLSCLNVNYAAGKCKIVFRE